MGDTFFRKNNLEDKITNSNLPDSVPNETINLEKYYAELGKEMRRDFYDSEFKSSHHKMLYLLIIFSGNYRIL